MKKNLFHFLSRSVNPADFAQKYKEAKGADTSVLAPMMEILHGLTGDEVTRRHFSKDGGGGHKANDYQGLKERLLQQVVQLQPSRNTECYCFPPSF